MKKTAAFCLVTLLFAGCAAKSSYIKDTFDYNDAYLAGIKARTITIVDERKEVSDRRLDPAFFARAGSGDRVSPELSEQQKTLIQDEILKYLGKNGQEYDITVYVQKAEKAIRSAWPKKYESAEVSLRIRLENASGIKTCSNEALLEVKSLKATGEFLDKLYVQALRECIHGCFAALKKETSY